MRSIFALALSALLLLPGNPSRAEGTSPTHFSPPGAPAYFVLDDDLVLTTQVKNIFGRVAQLHPVLSRGKYVSVFADADGTYYQGPKGCLPNPNKDALFKALDGGLWLPGKDSKLKPRLWFYMQAMPDSMGRKAGLIIRYLDGLSAGNVRKDPGEIVDFSFMTNVKLLPYEEPAASPSAPDPGKP